jgi:hypothetical protein
MANKENFIWQVHYLWYLIPWGICDHVTFTTATYCLNVLLLRWCGSVK